MVRSRPKSWAFSRSLASSPDFAASSAACLCSASCRPAPGHQQIAQTMLGVMNRIDYYLAENESTHLPGKLNGAFRAVL